MYNETRSLVNITVMFRKNSAAVKVSAWIIAVILCIPVYIEVKIGVPMYLEKVNPNTYHEGLMAGTLIALWLLPLFIIQISILMYGLVNGRVSIAHLFSLIPGILSWLVPISVAGI